MMNDDELAAFARMRDGQWSVQTQAVMLRFKTDKLNLNRAWAGTWQGWTCPCCNRTKPQIARLTSANVLLCQLDSHHDHLGDKAGKLFEEVNKKTDDREFNIQVSHAKYGMLQFVERFQRTLICIDCNLAEGTAKKSLGTDMDPDFTFSPREIAAFIRPADNRTHELDHDAVRSTWNRLKPDIADRMAFAEEIARRFADGQNRREVAVGARGDLWIDDRAVIWEQVVEALPRLGRGNSIGMKVLSRSVARHGVGSTQKAKTKSAGKPPTDAEYATIETQNSGQKHWTAAGEDWTCECCKRSKREICRRSNTGKWTARIHVVREWIYEDDATKLRWRGGDVTGRLVIGSHMPVLICQDCRHVVSEIQRRDDTVEESSLTLDDISAAIIAIAANQMHEVNYPLAIETAKNNRELVAAVDDYQEHERTARAKHWRAKWIAKSLPCSIEEARGILAYEHAKAEGIDLDEADDYMAWLLNEGVRFENATV
jgi:rubredoxin